MCDPDALFPTTGQTLLYGCSNTQTYRAAERKEPSVSHGETLIYFLHRWPSVTHLHSFYRHKTLQPNTNTKYQPCDKTSFDIKVKKKKISYMKTESEALCCTAVHQLCHWILL